MSNTGNTQQIIDYGAAPNDGTGDPLRTAFIKTDENFSNIWLAGPVGSNITITNNVIQANNTNGNVVIKPNGIGAMQVNGSIVPDITQVRDLGSQDRKFRSLYLSGDISTTGNITADNIAIADDLSLGGNVNILGDLTVNGNTITVNVANLNITDKMIVIANGSPNAQTANGAGITVGGANAQLVYQSSTDSWNSNKNFVAEKQFSAGGFANEGWDFIPEFNFLSFPSGASWESNKEFLTEYISSATDGYLSLRTYDSLRDFATEVDIEHEIIRFKIYNGVDVEWNMLEDGSTKFPNYTFPSADGNPREVLRTDGAGNLSWQSPDTGFISNGNSAVIIPVQDGKVEVQVNGNIFWDFNADGTLTGAGNILPRSTNNYSLGNSTSQWKSMWISNSIVMTPTDLANLTAQAGARAFANDANLAAAGNFGAQVAGGGANTVPVWSDGTNWYIG